MAVKVTVRKKKISKGRFSLYLEYYPSIPHPTIEDKEIRKEYLKLYTSEKPKNNLQKIDNENALRTAEYLRSEKQNRLNKEEVYTELEKKELKRQELPKLSFINYFHDLAKKKSGSNSDNWYSSYKHFLSYTEREIKFSDLNVELIIGFKEYLLNASSRKHSNKKIAKNTASAYFKKLKEALKQAFVDGIIDHDLGGRIKSIPEEEVLKNTLTIEELRHIDSIEFEESPLTKTIVLFSCLTGLPFKELTELTWAEIEKSETFGIRVRTKRKKTTNNYELYISDTAYELLGEPKNPDNKVFDGLSNDHRYRMFQILMAKAGITKKITFHDLRHTYATLQIEYGTDIYTLQKQMNHKNIAHTQRYATASDRRKREAADKIKLK